jgi:hypothetical protein
LGSLIGSKGFFAVVSGDHRVTRIPREYSYERADIDVVFDEQDCFAVYSGSHPLSWIIGQVLVLYLLKSAHFTTWSIVTIIPERRSI